MSVYVCVGKNDLKCFKQGS